MRRWYKRNPKATPTVLRPCFICGKRVSVSEVNADRIVVYCADHRAMGREEAKASSAWRRRRCRCGRTFVAFSSTQTKCDTCRGRGGDDDAPVPATRMRFIPISSERPSTPKQSSDLYAELQADPGKGTYRWRISSCESCGDPMVKKTGRHIDCDDCAQRKRSSRWEKDRKPTDQRKAHCTSCGLVYHPRPGDGPECAVCAYEKVRKAGGTNPRLMVKSHSLKEKRLQLQVTKPPRGKCFICSKPTKGWYCSQEHMRAAYKILIARMEE